MAEPARAAVPDARTQYEPVIGLEVHCQLLTAAKIFCSCPNRFGDPPNTNVCPVCLGLPGALPVLSRHAVTLALRAALATGCIVHPVSVFARKNYFYPDLPKGYQISQYERPLATGGHIEIADGASFRRVRLNRIHMEEDAGKLLHEGFAWSDSRSGVDFNRSGVPLIEIVSEPDLRSAEEAHEYLTSLKAILLYAGVSDGNMEEGSLRCDANVSVRRAGTHALGTRVEVKNLNSFRNVARAIEHETRRQAALVESGREVVQETRLWNADKGETASMRGKEDAHDYRYFPEPDLPPLVVTPEWVDDVRASLPGCRPPGGVACRRARAAGVRRGRAHPVSRGRGLLRVGRAGERQREGRVQLGDDRGPAQTQGRPEGAHRGGAGAPGRAHPADRRGNDLGEDREGGVRADVGHGRGARGPGRARGTGPGL
jgi:aspartyl-tRNA(Asn)/glutamyl-tRNA(Gln) amidotransferase subunit B